MNICLICCPFKTSFGWYCSALKAALEKRTGDSVQWVASNCGCGTPMAEMRQFQVAKEKCDYFEMPIPGDLPSTSLWESRLRAATRTVFTYLKAKRYADLSSNAEVVHFHQILNAYGAKTVFHWLNRPSESVRVVTVHELDPDQLKVPEVNTTYNRADAIIVHCEEMKQRLLGLGVRNDKLHLVLHGTHLPAQPTDNHRDGLVFYGGHFLTHNKGLDTVLRAMSILHKQLDPNRFKLKIHGQYGSDLREQAIQLAKNIGVANDVVWLDQLFEDDVVELYLRSQICVLPYTGSFAGFAASLAAACWLPVVATRKAGLPDHLGDDGIWVEENNPEQLAAKITELLSNTPMRQEIGAKLRKRAEQCLGWDRIADRTLSIYEEAVDKKASATATLRSRRWARSTA